jgi:hypothetical protein
MREYMRRRRAAQAAAQGRSPLDHIKKLCRTLATEQRAELAIWLNRHRP